MTDFSSLNGYVIFAYPEYNIIKTNPSDPNSGWGTRTCKLVYPLTGKNAEMIPSDAIGYRMDSTCNASTWNNNAYSYTNIDRLFEGDMACTDLDHFYSSVYCYVSKDFNGTFVRISTEGNVSGKIVQQYDLEKKDSWQKLQIDFKIKSSDHPTPVYLYWSKFGVTDFSTLKGYVIFAYPRYYKETGKTGE